MYANGYVQDSQIKVDIAGFPKEKIDLMLFGHVLEVSAEHGGKKLYKSYPVAPEVKAEHIAYSFKADTMVIDITRPAGDS